MLEPLSNVNRFNSNNINVISAKTHVSALYMNENDGDLLLTIF